MVVDSFGISIIVFERTLNINQLLAKLFHGTNILKQQIFLLRWTPSSRIILFSDTAIFIVVF